MKKLLLLALLALGLSGCDKVMSQDKSIIIRAQHPGLVTVIPITTDFLCQEATTHQSETVWKVCDQQWIDIYSPGELVKVGEAIVYPDNTYEIIKYNNNKMQSLFRTYYVTASIRPQNR
jgi:hypothetical protein